MLQDWNPKEPSASFRRFAEDVREQSKSVFLKDGFHTELFFFVSYRGEACIVKPHKMDDRDRMMAELKRRIRSEGPFGVVHISETSVKVPLIFNDLQKYIAPVAKVGLVPSEPDSPWKKREVGR